MASFCQQDPHYTFWWRYKRHKTGNIDEPLEGTTIYPRGWAFFEYLDAVHGRDAVKKFIDLVVRKGKSAKEAASTVTGLKWDTLRDKEREWSTSWLRRYPRR